MKLAEVVRLNPFSIGAKLSLLVTVMVTLSSVILSLSLIDKARDEVVDHERIDLEDEANLVCRDVSNEVWQLRTDTYRLAAVISADERRERVAEWQQTRLGYLAMRLLEVDAEGNVRRELASWTQPEFEALDARGDVAGLLKQAIEGDRRLVLSDLRQVLKKAANQENGEPVTILTSAIALTEPAVALLDMPADEFANRATDGGIVAEIVMSLDRIDRIARSPRHLLFMVDEDKRFILHPQWQKTILGGSGGGGQIHTVDAETEVVREGLSVLDDLWKSTAQSPEDDLERSRGHRHSEGDGSVALGQMYGFYFNESEDLNADYQLLKGVIDRIKAERWERGGISVTRGERPRIRIRGSTEKEAIALQQEIAGSVRDDANLRGVKVGWKRSRPIHCQDFMTHFNRVYFDPDFGPTSAAPRYVDLVTAISKEEVEFGVETSMVRPAWIQSGVLILIAVLLAVASSRVITRPLNRIIRSTEQLAGGDMNVSLPVRDKGEVGELARSFEAMIIQIRERNRALKDRETRLSAIVNTAAEGIVTCDDQGRVQSLNPAAEQIFAIDSRDAVGRSFRDLLHADQPPDGGSEGPSGAGLLEQLCDGTSERNGRRGDGSRFPVEVSASAAMLETGRIFTAIVRDVTRRKEAEREIRDLNNHLKELNEELDARVREQTADLQRTNAELIVARDNALAANRAKSAFLAQMSHELRTPLNAIIGYSELLIEVAEDEEQTEYIADLRKIIDAGKHLLALISDILDLAKIEAGRMSLHLDEIPVADVVSKLTPAATALAAKNQNQLEFDCPAEIGTIRSDGGRLEQILTKLISNACKFTERGRVTLSVRAQDREGVRGVAFRVADTGVGMTEDQISSLFENFAQADDSTTRRYGGAGTGLAICRRFTNLLGGAITVESEKGAGSTFTLWLPKVPPARVNSSDGEAGTFPAATNPSDMVAGLPFRIESIELAAFAESILQTATPLAAKKQNELTLDCPPDIGTISCDRTRLRQILFNLLSNSCKFTEQGRVGLALAREGRNDADGVLFSVSDTGIGMTQEQVQNLFQDFRQADDSTVLKYGGTGLGLAISKRFCDRLGGQISAESASGAGTTFRVWLPASQAGDAAPTPQAVGMHVEEPSAPAKDDSVETVLVIDDDPAARELMRRNLEREGFRVVVAESGPEGLELARQAQPSFITLDVMMPNMDGWDVLTAIKSDSRLHGIPVAIVSIIDDKSLGFALGASGYMTKPIDRARLLSIVERFRELGAGHADEILVVEDDEPTRELLCRNLKGAGWSVAEAGNGKLALERIQEQAPALIVLDLMMPEMDGFEFLDELHQRDDWQRIPVVVVTARELSDEERDRLNGEVQQILQKGSYTRRDLLGAICGLMPKSEPRSGLPAGAAADDMLTPS